ncbi:PBSX family phage terminase large subunit [Empedobacter sp. 189-2]|uniref:PBSX family phage terminase large subunit n=1 Tax=Empedobacter sp. 189-2 TaxID=2746724 RepID=UPI0025752126|nr:PBSX family phage terminase large subunit [Empedobacter sp. 189-2]MDM1542351.1 PBSX family phage terminase large subunit [Empedobacter sp. 189-2]
MKKQTSKIEINHKYQSLITSSCRYHILTGGRSSAKSFSATSLICIMMLTEKRTILFLRKTLTSADISIIPEFVDKLERLGVAHLFVINKTEITCTLTGSVIFFRGIQTSSKDNTANLKSIADVSLVILDEAEELTDETTFDRIDLSVRKLGVINKVILILNPTTREHWIYRRFFIDNGVNEDFNGQKEDTNYIYTTYLDNKKNIDPSFIRSVELMKKNNPAKYQHTILGGWLQKAEGVVFENWQLGEFDESLSVIYGQDFGFSIDPTTLVKVGIDKKQMRIYLKELLYKPNLSTSQIFELNNSLATAKGLIIADNAEPRLISELQRMGLNIIPAIKGAGSITAGISMMQDYQLIIDPSSTNLIKELNNYSWLSKENKSVPIDKYNHLIDACRMAVYYQLKGVSGTAKRFKSLK